MRIFPVWRRVAEIGLMGIRYGSVTHVPVTCGTLAAQVCARAGAGRPKVPAASTRRANRALRCIWVLFPRAGIQPEQVGTDDTRQRKCASAPRWQPSPPESNGHATEERSRTSFGAY